MIGKNASTGHPALAAAAVVGAPDGRCGEMVTAFVVKRPGHEIAADALLGHCRHNIACTVKFIDALPKLPNGKVEKWAARDSAVQSALAPAH